MKKMVLLCTAALATTILVTAPCAHQSTNSGNIVMAASKDRLSNAEYAVMGFLQYSKQQVDAVQDGSLQLDKDGDIYTLNDGNNQFNIMVSKKKVTVKSTDQNNTEKKHIYSKALLRKKFKGQAAAIKTKVNNQTDQSAAPTTTQQSEQQANQSAASDTADRNNNSGQPGMIPENEWYQRLIAAGWDENSQTVDYYSHKAGLDGVPVAPQ